MDNKEKISLVSSDGPVNEFLNPVEEPECSDDKFLIFVVQDLIKCKFLTFLSHVLTLFCPFWLFV